MNIGIFCITLSACQAKRRKDRCLLIMSPHLCFIYPFLSVTRFYLEFLLFEMPQPFEFNGLKGILVLYKILLKTRRENVKLSPQYSFPASYRASFSFYISPLFYVNATSAEQNGKSSLSKSNFRSIVKIGPIGPL